MTESTRKVSQSGQKNNSKRILLLAGSCALIALGFYGVLLIYNVDPTTNAMLSASEAIDQSYQANNRLPSYKSGNALLTGFMDEWNTPLRYRPNQYIGTGAWHDYQLISAGPDGQFDTPDDIVKLELLFGGFGPGGVMGPQLSKVSRDKSSINKINSSFNSASKHISGSAKLHSSLPNANQGNSLLASISDPWQNTFRYEPGHSKYFFLTSAGPDGQWNTGDEMTQAFKFSPGGQP
ncbi:MAG: type II secretion system protein GspG [Phycisphaeraceae bacterium]